MPRNTFRMIIVLATISLLGIVATQIFWLIKAFDLREKQFTFNVNLALKNVVASLCEYDGTDVPDLEPIEKLSSNYFIVRTDQMIDPASLEYFLRAELSKRSLGKHFEYGIYNCSSETIVYSKEVNLNANAPSQLTKTFPVLDPQNYYFGVYFPDRPAYIAEEMSIWLFSTAVLLIVVIYFSYTLYVILKQQRLSQMQRDFINNMTHEFKTPLASIAISAEVLKSNSEVYGTDRIKKYADIICAESEKLTNHVDRVLKLGSLDKEELILEKNTVDVNSIIQIAIDELGMVQVKSKSNIFFKPYPNIPLIEGDEFHLTNAIKNLLDNALKYSSDPVDIRINSEYNCHKKLILISVSDHGVGISKHDLPHVFDRFYRVSRGDLHDVKGFGIGLHYVKSIVEAHKGRITVESKIGVGSIFKIMLRA